MHMSYKAAPIDRGQWGREFMQHAPGKPGSSNGRRQDICQLILIEMRKAQAVCGSSDPELSVQHQHREGGIHHIAVAVLRGQGQMQHAVGILPGAGIAGSVFSAFLRRCFEKLSPMENSIGDFCAKRGIEWWTV